MRTLSMLLFAMTALAAFAQEATPVYRVEYVFRDKGADAAQEARRYTLLVNSSGKGNLRLVNKVPYPNGQNQINYADVGMFIECRVGTMNGGVILGSDLEISSVSHFERSANALVPTPTVTSTRLSLNTGITPGKPAVLATVDDPATQRKLEVEATVTSIGSSPARE